MTNRVSVAELVASDIHLRPAEAVAIVSAICAQCSAGTLPGIPSPGIIRLTRDGELVVEGPITTAQDSVTRAALLLTDLLSGFDTLPEYRASGALRLVIARGLGAIDLPPYASLDEFCQALSRFDTEDVRAVAQALYLAWERASVTRAFQAAPRADLTISDVRRARRATGLTLRHLSSVAEVPSSRLRDLEWGYMHEWPATAEARAQVIRYARAAGLDESIVLSIAWPMIVDQARTALVPAPPRAMAVIEAKPVPARTSRRHWRAAIVAAAATLALLGAFLFGWHSSPGSKTAHDTVSAGIGGRNGAPALDESPAEPRAGGVRLRAVATSSNAEAPEPVDRPAAAPAADPAPAAAPSKPKRRRAPARGAVPPREEPRKSRLFERELFRIVIR